MMSDIILRRPIAISSWRIVGQIAKASKRADVLSILLRVQEQGESNAKDIATHLFFEARSRKAVAERMLRIAVAYRLLEQGKSKGEYKLTYEGHKAIEDEQVFVPEEGTWTIWASGDPLLGSRVLKVEPWQEPSAYDEVWGNKRDKKRDFESLPEWLREVEGQVQLPCAHGGESLRIDKIETKAEAFKDDSTLMIEWAVGARRLQVSGNVARSGVQVDLDPPMNSYAEVWRELLQKQGLWKSWDAEKKALFVGFESTDETERESMTRTLRIDRPSLAGLGTFDTLSVSDVGIAPRTQRDAEDWARWRLESRVRDYATQRRMEEWTQAARKPFVDYEISLPTRSMLARDAWKAREERPAPKTWHFVAAEDWRL